MEFSYSNTVKTIDDQKKYRWQRFLNDYKSSFKNTIE